MSGPVLEKAPRVASPVGIFLLLTLPLAVGAFWIGAQRILDVRRAEADTRTAIGTVVSSRVEMLPCHGTCRGGPAYRPGIVYRYTVGGRAFLSGTVTSIGDAGHESWATEVVARHPPRGETPVHYRVDEPAKAYLEPTRTGAYWALALLPLSLVSACGLSMWRANLAATVERRG